MSRDATRRERPPASTRGEASNWYFYLTDLGPVATRWADDFREPGFAMAQRTQAILRQLQQGDMDGADESLADAERFLRSVARTRPPAVMAILEMSYWSIEAYREYGRRRTKSATESLGEAVRCIERAIAVHPFLVPVAGRCYDFQLHLGRIARAEADWPSMWRQLAAGREMMAGVRPLCRPLTGPVYLDDLCRFYRDIEPRNELEAEASKRLGNPETIQREFDALCLSVTIAPFVVLDWADGRPHSNPVPAAPTQLISESRAGLKESKVESEESTKHSAVAAAAG